MLTTFWGYFTKAYRNDWVIFVIALIDANVRSNVWALKEIITLTHFRGLWYLLIKLKKKIKPLKFMKKLRLWLIMVQ